MAKFTLNCEFDSLEELREFLTQTRSDGAIEVSCTNGADVESSEETSGEVEQPKRRRRRTKAEIEADAQLATQTVVQEVEEVVNPTDGGPLPEVPVIPVEEVRVVPPHQIELVPNVAAAPFLTGVASAQVSPGAIQFSAPPVEQVATVEANNGLPADLLGALSGLGK